MALELRVRVFVKSAVISSSSPLNSVFDLPQLSGSFNVQDGGIALFPEKKTWLRCKIRLLCRLQHPKTYTNVMWIHFVWHFIWSQQLRAIFYITYRTLQLSDQPCLRFYVFLKLLCKYLNFRRNRTIAWWRHFTTTTRIVQFFVLLVQIRAFLNFIFNLTGTNLNKKTKTKWILVVVVKRRHR